MKADIVQIQVCENHGLLGSSRATIGKTIFTCVYIEKIFIHANFPDLCGNQKSGQTVAIVV
jgi:hypothetical protein